MTPVNCSMENQKFLRNMQIGLAYEWRFAVRPNSGRQKERKPIDDKQTFFKLFFSGSLCHYE